MAEVVGVAAVVARELTRVIGVPERMERADGNARLRNGGMQPGLVVRTSFAQCAIDLVCSADAVRDLEIPVKIPKRSVAVGSIAC